MPSATTEPPLDIAPCDTNNNSTTPKSSFKNFRTGKGPWAHCPEMSLLHLSGCEKCAVFIDHLHRYRLARDPSLIAAQETLKLAQKERLRSEREAKRRIEELEAELEKSLVEKEATKMKLWSIELELGASKSKHTHTAASRLEDRVPDWMEDVQVAVAVDRDDTDEPPVEEDGPMSHFGVADVEAVSQQRSEVKGSEEAACNLDDDSEETVAMQTPEEGHGVSEAEMDESILEDDLDERAVESDLSRSSNDSHDVRSAGATPPDSQTEITSSQLESQPHSEFRMPIVGADDHDNSSNQQLPLEGKWFLSQITPDKPFPGHDESQSAGATRVFSARIASIFACPGRYRSLLHRYGLDSEFTATTEAGLEESSVCQPDPHPQTDPHFHPQLHLHPRPHPHPRPYPYPNNAYIVDQRSLVSFLADCGLDPSWAETHVEPYITELWNGPSVKTNAQLDPDTLKRLRVEVDEVDRLCGPQSLGYDPISVSTTKLEGKDALNLDLTTLPVAPPHSIATSSAEPSPSPRSLLDRIAWSPQSPPRSQSDAHLELGPDTNQHPPTEPRRDRGQARGIASGSKSWWSEGGPNRNRTKKNKKKNEKIRRKLDEELDDISNLRFTPY